MSILLKLLCFFLAAALLLYVFGSAAFFVVLSILLALELYAKEKKESRLEKEPIEGLCKRV